MRSTFAGFLDDDDEMLPGHLDRLVAALDAQPGVGLAFARSEVRASDGRVLGQIGRPADAVELLGDPPFTMNAALFRSNLIDRGVRLDPTFEIGEDIDFWLQCVMHTTLFFVDAISTVWNAEAGSSGAGTGGNVDVSRMLRASARLDAKWLLPVYEAQTGWRGRFAVLRHSIVRDRHDIATALLARINDVLPDDPNLLRLGALHAARKGEHALAILRYEAAIAVAPQVSVLREELAALRQKISACTRPIPSVQSR